MSDEICCNTCRFDSNYTHYYSLGYNTCRDYRKSLGFNDGYCSDYGFRHYQSRKDFIKQLPVDTLDIMG